MVDVNYKKLWKLLIDKGMKKGDLQRGIPISSRTVARLGKNEHVSLEVLLLICRELDCELSDILEAEY